MLNSILQEVYQEVLGEFDDLLQQRLSFFVIIEKMVRHFVAIANNELIKVKFLYVLTNGYSFIIDEQVRESTFRIIRDSKELGYTTGGDLDKEISEDDLYLILFVNTIKYISQRYKNSSTRVKIFYCLVSE